MTNDNSSNWSNLSGARAGRGGSNVGRDQHNIKRTQLGGLVAVIAVIIVAVVAIWAGRAIYEKVTSGELTADSTCAEFLQAPQDKKLAAIPRIGIEKGVRGAGSPLAPPAINYDCSNDPDAKLGDVIAKYKGQF